MDLRGPRLFALWLLERILEARASQTPGRVGVSLTRQLRRAPLLADMSLFSQLIDKFVGILASVFSLQVCVN